MSTQSKLAKDAGCEVCPGHERLRTQVQRSYACSCALADLALDVLALVANPLALVGLGRALLADDRRGLPDELLGDPLHDDARRLRHFELDALRRGNRNRMGVADGELEVLALQLCAI